MIEEEPDSAAEVDAGDEDAGVPDDVEPFKDAELVDLGPEEDAEVPFDREDPTVIGCDCRAGASNVPRGGLGLLALGLLATAPRALIEGNGWHDNFWGACHCARRGARGANHLGRILMAVRDGARRG